MLQYMNVKKKIFNRNPVDEHRVIVDETVHVNERV